MAHSMQEGSDPSLTPPEHHAQRWVYRRGARELLGSHVRHPRDLASVSLVLRLTLTSISRSFSNTIQSMFAVLEALPLLSLVLSPDNEGAADMLADTDPDERIITAELIQAMVALWNDTSVKAAMGT